MAYEVAAYKPMDFSALRGLTGITNEQIEVHLKLYEGYVNRTNALLGKIATLVNEGKIDSTYQELKRRVGWEFNGMRLHEYYFKNLKPAAGTLAESHRFAQAVARQWGSAEVWKTELANTAKLPGVGWAITYQDDFSGQLFNQWVTHHEEGHPAGCRPIVVLDVWEHAFSVYKKPTERAAYLDDFFANLDWDAAASRLK